MTTTKQHEVLIRRHAARHHLRLTKSRLRNACNPDFERYALVCNANNFPVTPGGVCTEFGCTLDEIEAYLVAFESEASPDFAWAANPGNGTA